MNIIFCVMMLMKVILRRTIAIR